MPSHYSKKAQKIEELRIQLCKVRDELDKMKREDSIWEIWLNPGRYGITLIISSLHQAAKEIDKHYLRWLSKTYEVFRATGEPCGEIIVDNELEKQGITPLDAFASQFFKVSLEHAKKNREYYSKLFSLTQIKNKKLD